MPEFRLVQNPDRSPTACAFCGDFVGPFIDTSVTIEGYGGIFICAANERRSGCLTQMGNLAGMTSATEKFDMYEQLNSLEAEISELEQQVAAFQQLKELQAFFSKRELAEPIEKETVDAA